MLNEIDSSEIVVYLARKKFMRRNSAIISMSDIFQLADFLTQNDATIRVNLSLRSLENLSNYTYHQLSFDNDEVRIEDMHHPRIQFVMNQYRPSIQTIKMLNKVQL